MGKVFATNKFANRDFELLETTEAGLVLRGHEVKSIKTGHISLQGAYVAIRDNHAYLVHANVPLYKMTGNITDYDPIRERELLLRKEEVKRLMGSIQAKGLTLVPIRVYTKQGLVKLSFALARGKKKYDKRQDIKKRDAERRLKRVRDS